MSFPLPEGVTQEMAGEIRRKRQAGEPLTPAESTASARMREAFQRMREQQGGGTPGAPAQGGAPGAAPTAAPQAGGGTGGSGMRLPPGVTQAEVSAIFRKRQSGQALTAQEQATLTRVMQGGQQAGGSSQRRRSGAGSDFLFGGSYIVFVLDSGRPMPRRIRTGYTDMDYSEVVSGLTARDTVLLLPSASLVNQQQQMRDRMSQMGGGVPGMSGGRPPGGPR